MKAKCLLVLLTLSLAEAAAQQPLSSATTNATSTDAATDLAPQPSSDAPRTFIPDPPSATTNSTSTKAGFTVLEPEALLLAQSRYREDARTNHINLDKPQYTNAPWSESRLRAAALKGDGLAASLCSGSNSLEQLFWVSLAATNGWLPSQVRLAKEYGYEPPKNLPRFRSKGPFQEDPIVGIVPQREDTIPSGIQNLDSTERDAFHKELNEILKQPKDIRNAARTFWWSKAKAGLPKLKADAAHNETRAIYALGLLHQAGDLVEHKPTRAPEMFHKAAILGLPVAQAAWGSHCACHLTNQVEAAAWYYQAATQGLVSAQASLSWLHSEPSQWQSDPDSKPWQSDPVIDFHPLRYFDPRFEPKAHERARWTFERATQPIPCFPVYSACNDMGDLYLSGLGVESNAVEAVRWYRRAIELRIPYGEAEYKLALCYFGGDGVPQDDNEGLTCIRRAKEKGYSVDGPWEEFAAANALDSGDYHTAMRLSRKNAAQGKGWAQFALGLLYHKGTGVANDSTAASEWFRKAAERGNRTAQFSLALAYDEGEGVPQDYAEALKWYRKAASQGQENSQNNLGVMYQHGHGVPQDYVEAYKWYNLAAAHGDEVAIENRDNIVQFMTPSQIAEGQRLAREFKTSKPPDFSSPILPQAIVDSAPAATGTGFFITESGFLISSAHVVEGAAQLKLVTRAGVTAARVVKLDEANDLALLKAEGTFEALPIAPSRGMRMGNAVLTIGFPNIGLQGFAPKLSKGEIAALSGAQDDPRYFQISVPVQPGNSGGALVDERGNVVGVMSAKLSLRAALATSGSLPENVNYAVKSSFLLGFLESVPEISAKLKEPNTKDQKFEEVLKSAEKAAALVLVY